MKYTFHVLRESREGSLLSCKVQADDGNRIQFFVLLRTIHKTVVSFGNVKHTQTYIQAIIF